jgi:3-dehydroquinate dehydratase II
MTTVLVLNGPNLAQLGIREPEIYGSQGYQDLVALCHKTGAELGLEIEVRQTDAEHEMLSWLHAAAQRQIPVVLNPAAWTHYSIAVADACAMLTAPLVEVHISNVYAREEFRRSSLISPHATAVLSGFGIAGYALALRGIAERIGA